MFTFLWYQTLDSGNATYRIRIHDLRHSHISLLIDMGFSAVAIADRVGHESIDITYQYAHLFSSKLNWEKRTSKKNGKYVDAIQAKVSPSIQERCIQHAFVEKACF